MWCISWARVFSNCASFFCGSRKRKMAGSVLTSKTKLFVCGGAEFATVTGSAGWAYHDLVGYAASALPGKNPDPATNSQYPFYDFDRQTGQQNPKSWGNNVIGFNDPSH